MDADAIMRGVESIAIRPRVDLKVPLGIVRWACGVLRCPLVLGGLFCMMEIPRCVL